MIARFFIERPILAYVLAIVIAIAGAVSYLRLPVEQFPEITPPTIQVTTRYPGASAEVVAATVGVPLEEALNGIEDALYLSSTSSSDGSYNLTVTFNVGTDLDRSLALVQNGVNSALAQLPSGATAQGVTARKVSTNILLVISLYAERGRLDPIFLSNYALINMQYPLARVPGVGQVRVLGAGPYSMRVWLDPERLRSFNLAADDVLAAVRNQNVQVTAGQLGAPPVPADQVFQLTATALGRLSSAQQFAEIIVKSVAGPAASVVRLRDVGRVELSQQSFSNFTDMGGQSSAEIAIFAEPGANAIAVANSIYRTVAEMSRSFPSGLKYNIHYDPTKFVREAVSSVYHALFIAALMVFVVVLVFLQSVRALLVPLVTVPVVIIGAFAAMLALGFTINLMTLFAVVLAIGIVVDDAIIIVENSAYYLERGLTRRAAALKAMEELTSPVLGVTLALVAVFVPAAFLPGISGQIFRQFALVIAATALLSAFIALTLNPVQCALYLRQRAERPRHWFYRGFNRGYRAVKEVYIGLVRRMVHRRWLMLVVFVATIGLAGWEFVRRPTGFLPTEDQGYAVLLARLPEGAAQPRARALTRQIDEVLRRTPGIAAWVIVGGFSLLDGTNVPTVCSGWLVYAPRGKRRGGLSQQQIVGQLNRALAKIEDADIVVMIPPPIRGLGQTGGFQLMVEDRQELGLAELQRSVSQLLQAGSAQRGLRGLTTTFSARSPQLYLDIDRTKAEAMQVPLSNIFDTLGSYLGSSFANLFNKFNQVFQVYVQAGASFRLEPEDIRRLYVRNARGQMVPLGSLLRVRRTEGTEVYTRYNLYPAASVFGSAASGFSSGQALRLMEQAAARTLPAGMGYEWTATAFQERQVGHRAYFIYALSVVLVFLVLAALYESWASPAAVVLVVPMALVGVLLALLIRGIDNNLYTQVGLVLMIALASKNAILIVEFARDLHGQGLSLVDAAIEATSRRFRPIMMTSLAFIAGAIPLVLAHGAGAASQQAIGTVVFGGMLASTLLAIPFVPVFFVLVHSRREREEGDDAPTGSHSGDS